MQKWGTLVIALSVAFFAGAAVSTVRNGATAQNTDAERIVALETRVASLVEDVISLSTDYDNQLLPEPRPASDFGASKFNAGSLSGDAVLLRCSTGTWADTYLDLLCDQVETP